jgi:predicted Ser/Thr protein kinase
MLQEANMAADQLKSFKHPDAGPRDREIRPRVSGSSRGLDRLAAGMVIPASMDTQRLPVLVEMVKLDLNREWLQGRPVNLESYLESFPELGTPETVSAELILAEYEVRCRSGEAVELAQFEERFPHQAVALRQLIDQQTPKSAADSMLDQLGEMAGIPQHRPLSLARDAKAAPTLPRRFGRYRVLELLGQGAMGTVYLVRDTQLHRQVALKVPHFRPGDGDGTPDQRVLGRFYREAHAAAILRHPNLCPVYDVGQIDGIPYLTMAYIRGRPLSRYIDRDRPLSPRWVAVLVRKLALALRAAHDKGVIHRDMKPSNVMIGAGRQPIIMDFGLAWCLDRGNSDERLTRLGLVLGTPAYMSPEQLSGRVEEIGPRCDVYSLGVIFYELLTGRCPFEGPEAVVLGQVLFVEPERPTSHRPDLDPRLEAICLKAMAKRDDERYATMSELAAALGVYLRRTAPPRSPSTAVAPVLLGSNNAQPHEVRASDEADPCRGAREWGGPSTGQVNECPVAVAVLAPAGLLKSWNQWTATIASFARGRLSRRSTDPQAFAALRNQLLVTLRARAADVQGPEREFYLRLEGLISPWVSMRSLAREDREILHYVLARCQQVERILEGRSGRVAAGRVAAGEVAAGEIAAGEVAAGEVAAREVAAGGWLAVVSVVLAVASALLFWELVLK